MDLCLHFGRKVDERQVNVLFGYFLLLLFRFSGFVLCSSALVIDRWEYPKQSDCLVNLNQENEIGLCLEDGGT